MRKIYIAHLKKSTKDYEMESFWLSHPVKHNIKENKVREPYNFTKKFIHSEVMEGIRKEIGITDEIKTIGDTKVKSRAKWMSKE